MALAVYRQFEARLRQQGIQTIPVPARVLTAASMGTSIGSAALDSGALATMQAALPDKLFSSLADFQKVGVHWGTASKHGRCLVADEPGLGKTIQAIGIAYHYVSEWPLLVIAPSSARFHWQAEVVKWLQNADGGAVVCESEVQVLTGGAQPIRPSTKCLVVSYDLADRVQAELNAVNDGQGFRVIVADECHMLKNQATKRAKAILPMLRRASRAILLSGTPALSRPKELWSQLNVIDAAQWPEYSKFCKRYCAGDAAADGHKGASNIFELHLLLRENCMIRRVKAEILKSLPPKRRVQVHVEIENTSLRKQIFDDFREFLTRTGEAARAAKKKSRLMLIAQERMAEQNVMDESGGSHGCGSSSSGSGNLSNRELAEARKSILMQLFKNTGTGKLPAIRRHCQGLLDCPTAPKFLVFAHHRDVLDSLESTVFKDVKIVRIDGKTPAKERQARIKAFQEDGTVRAAVLSITAAGVAITLTAASRAVFAELFWTPAALLQAEDRCHRIGQTAEVQVDYIVAQNSVDDVLWPLVQEKMKVIGEMVEGKKGASLALQTSGSGDEDEPDEVVEQLAREDRDAGVGDDDDGDDGEERQELDPATAEMDRQRLAAMREAEDGFEEESQRISDPSMSTGRQYGHHSSNGHGRGGSSSGSSSSGNNSSSNARSSSSSTSSSHSPASYAASSSSSSSGWVPGASPPSSRSDFISLDEDSGDGSSAFSMEQLQMDRLRSSLGMHAVPHTTASVQPHKPAVLAPTGSMATSEPKLAAPAQPLQQSSLSSVQQQQMSQLAALKQAQQQQKLLAQRRARLVQACNFGHSTAPGPRPTPHDNASAFASAGPASFAGRQPPFTGESTGSSSGHVDQSTLSALNPVDLSDSPELPSPAPSDLVDNAPPLPNSSHATTASLAPRNKVQGAANGSTAGASATAQSVVLPENALLDAQFDDLFESAGNGGLF